MNRSLAINLFDQLTHGYRTDHRFGAIYDQSPSGADDLTEIRGIATREAVILNRLGVYFFPQIALWTHQELCAFADELGMSASTVLDEQWVQQAQSRCRPRPQGPTTNSANLPASVIRTVSLLACALVVGCIMVYWVSQRSNHPLHGILAADITSIRVPTESRLLQAHVSAGDEVFSADALLTLEKTEHLEMINLQENRVKELERALQQANAQAALDLEWRTRELDREISDVRTRAHLIQEVKKPTLEPYKSASTDSDRGYSTKSSPYFSQVSHSKTAARHPRGLSEMIFISGESGESSIDVPRQRVPVIPPENSAPHPPRTVLASEPEAVTEGLLTVEARSVEMRLQRLEELREILPDQVRTAAGVESIRIQFDEATQRLTEIKALSRDVAVLCPGYGKVGQVRYKVGDTMSTGEVMLKILHTDRRFVLVHVPTRRVNEIQPGTIVKLGFPGNEYFRGKISNLPMLAEASMPGGQALATVRIEPVGKLWPEIPIGSQINVVVNK